MTRKLKDESTVEELVEAREYRIKTRCPHKWLLLDLETGERYRPYMTEGTMGNECKMRIFRMAIVVGNFGGFCDYSPVKQNGV